MTSFGCRPANFIDETGNRYGDLVVVKRAPDNTRWKVRWVCLCDCGKTVTRGGLGLRSGESLDCGCKRSERQAANPPVIIHGMSKSRLYKIWRAMKIRCMSVTDVAYGDYGGKGVSICDEWMNSSTFLSWALTNGYREDLTLDRYPDPNGNYCPENCRWATPKQQQRNRRNNFCLTLNGERKLGIEWSEITGIPFPTIYGRVTRGWSDEAALTIPSRSYRLKAAGVPGA